MALDNEPEVGMVHGETNATTGHVLEASDLGVEGAMGVPPDEPAGETPLSGRAISDTPDEDEYQSCGAMTNADERFIYQLARDIEADPERTVSEMYSPPRVTAAASALPHLGILPGFAMDLRTCDQHGVPWNFDLAERRQAAREQFHKEKPMVLIGTPMCTRWGPWQHINDKKRDPVEVNLELVKARVHLAFM